MTANDILPYSYAAYTHRSVSCSAIIREASFCSRWEQILPDIMQRLRDLGTPRPKWDVSIKSLPSALREPHGWGGRKSVRTRGDRGQRENKVVKTQCTQRLKQHTQGLSQVLSTSIMASSSGLLRFYGLVLGSFPSVGLSCLTSMTGFVSFYLVIFVKKKKKGRRLS